MSPPHPNEAPDGDASLPAGRLPKAIRLVPTHSPAPDPPPSSAPHVAPPQSLSRRVGGGLVHRTRRRTIPPGQERLDSTRLITSGPTTDYKAGSTHA